MLRTFRQVFASDFLVKMLKQPYLDRAVDFIWGYFTSLPYYKIYA